MMPNAAWDGQALEKYYTKYYQEVIPPNNQANATNYTWIADWCLDDLPAVQPDGGEMNDAFQLKFNHGMPPVSEGRERGAVIPESILVFADSYGFAKGIIDNAPKGRVGKVHYVTKPPSTVTDKELTELLGQKWDLLIYAVGIDPPPSDDKDEFHETQSHVGRIILKIAQHLLRKEDDIKRITVLTCDTFSDDPETNADGIKVICNAGLFGYTQTARQEVDTVAWQYIDTEWGLLEENMVKLADEVFRLKVFAHNNLRVLNSGRYVLRQFPAKEYEQRDFDFIMPEDGVIAITGGNGALGLLFGTWFLDTTEKQMKRFPEKKYKYTIKFCSRSMKISDANMWVWDTIQRKSAELGIACEQSKCDVSTYEKCEEFIKENAENLRGLVHSAGVIEDGMIINQTWERFLTVFASKSKPALYFHLLFEKYNCPIQFYWMFSSSSVYGNRGQANYGYSNSFMDSLARWRTSQGLPAVSMQWGAWGEIGMATTLDKATKQRITFGPYPYFSNAEGLAGLEAGLRTGLPLFATYKCNPDVCVQMVQGDDDHPGAQHGRNWIAETWPLPPCMTYDNLYNLYRFCYAKPKKDGPRMNFDRFIRPYIED